MNKIKSLIIAILTVTTLLVSTQAIYAADIVSGTEYWGPRIFKWHRSTDGQFGVAVLWDGRNWVPHYTIDGTFNSYANDQDAFSAWEGIKNDCENDDGCDVGFPSTIEVTRDDGDITCTVSYGQGEVCGTSTTDEVRVHVPVSAGLGDLSVSTISMLLAVAGIGLSLGAKLTRKNYLLDK